MDLHLWIFVLLVQSLPYFSAVVVSCVSAFPKLSAGFIGRPAASTDA
jgi:hypothetical protein